MKALYFTTATLALVLTTSFARAQDSQTSTTKTTTTEEKTAGGLFVEPMITAESSNTSINTSQIPLLSDTSGTLKGGGLGLRLGGHIGDVIFLAADGRYTRNDLDDSTYQKASTTGYNYGATLGVQTPYWGIRLWGTDVLGGAVDPDTGASGVNVKFDGARGYRVGGGIRVLSVAINLEYQDLTYSRSTIQSVGDAQVNQDTNIDFTERGPILSLSFPISL